MESLRQAPTARRREDPVIALSLIVIVAAAVVSATAVYRFLHSRQPHTRAARSRRCPPRFVRIILFGSKSTK